MILIQKFHQFCQYIFNEIYNGNSFALKFEPVFGTILGLSVMGFIDAHWWEVSKFIGSILLTCITVFIGSIGPMLYRFWMHRLSNRFPVFKEILKHDNKKKQEGQ